ncbi:hypothetical protein APX01_21690 (plasmid) [Cereibacter sphaeroides]|nr:hypothetical protein APX01_21690 [Cereibacter sphaeroides]
MPGEHTTVWQNVSSSADWRLEDEHLVLAFTHTVHDDILLHGGTISHGHLDDVTAGHIAGGTTLLQRRAERGRSILIRVLADLHCRRPSYPARHGLRPWRALQVRS